jgi:hypothetical protein
MTTYKARMFGLLSTLLLLAGCPQACDPAPAPSTTTAPAPQPTTAPPPAPTRPPAGACRLSGAAFCEDFEGARNTVGNRNGDLSTARFSGARWNPSTPDPQWVERAQIPACRGTSSTPFPPGDALICNPVPGVGTRHALIATAIQNYGDHSYRIAQPFDVANRTGTISFDVDLTVDDGLLGFPTMTFAADPYSAPAYGADNAAGATPREGVTVFFNGVCPTSAGWTFYPVVRTYHRYVETQLRDAQGRESGGCPLVKRQAGRLNHVEVRISRTRIEIWASDPSADGIRFPAARQMFSAPLNLPFSRGNVSFAVHNHATGKYAGLPSWNVRWDNIAFDGPLVPVQRVAQVPNNNVAVSGGMQLGYWLADRSTTSNPPTLTFSSVSTSGMSKARLVFNMSTDNITNRNWAEWRVHYRLNGTTWRTFALSADELTALGKRAGTFAFSVDVPFADVRNGVNTIQFGGTGFFGGYKPYIGNIDLVLS